MSITGDFSKLKGIIETLGGIQGPDFRKGVCKQLASEAQSLIAEGFRKERDPYGMPWKKSARANSQNGQTLADTGKLKNAWQGRSVERVDGAGFVLANNTRYAMAHQRGMTITAKTPKGLRFKIGGRWVRKNSVTLPKRMMVPEGTLGPMWFDAFKDVATDYVQAYVKKQAGKTPRGSL